MTRLQHRNDTAANFTGGNKVLLMGERAYETDTKKWKTGDGVTAWNVLAYESAGGIASIATAPDRNTVDLSSNASIAAISQAAANAQAAANTKITALAPVVLTSATTLTHDAHSGRQLVSNTSAPVTHTLATDAQAAAAGSAPWTVGDNVDMIIAAGSTGIPTIATPDGKRQTFTTSNIGATCAGANAWTVGTTAQGAVIPAVASIAAAGATVYLTFAVPMFQGSLPGPSAFSGVKNAAAWVATATAWASPTKLAVTMNSAAAAGDSVTFSFSEGTTRLLSLDSNTPVRSFAAAAATVLSDPATAITQLFFAQPDQTYYAPDWGSNSGSDGMQSFNLMGTVGRSNGPGYLETVIKRGSTYCQGTLGIGVSNQFFTGDPCDCVLYVDSGSVQWMAKGSSSPTVIATLPDTAGVRIARGDSNAVTIDRTDDGGITWTTIYTFATPLPTGQTISGCMGNAYSHTARLLQPKQYGFVAP